MSFRLFARILTFFMLLSLCLIFSLTFYQPKSDKPDISAQFLVDFKNILNSNWYPNSPPILSDREDWLGFNKTIIGSSTVVMRHKNDPLAFISQTVVQYEDSEAASKRFVEQKISIEDVRNWGNGEKTILEFDLEDLDADASAVTCYIYQDDHAKIVNMRCTAIFLYNDYITYLNIFPVRNYIRYLKFHELNLIFKAVNMKMISTH